MPIYEYRCEQCDAVFELLRPRAQRDAGTTCPACGGVTGQLMMSSFSGRMGMNSVAGSGGCGSCKASSCAGCSKN